MRRGILWRSVGFAAAVLGGWWIFAWIAVPHGGLLAAGLAFPLAVGAAGVGHWWFVRGFAARYKADIVRRVVTHVHPDLVYEPQKGVAKGFFDQSGLFEATASGYRADDLVSGEIGGVRFRCSEVLANHATYHHRKRRWHEDHWDERSYTTYKWLFHGLLVVVDLPPGDGSLADSADIPAAFLTRMPAFERLGGRKPLIARQGDRLFLAVPFDRDLFEPRLLRGLIDFRTVAGYHQALRLVVEAIQDLGADVKSW